MKKYVFLLCPPLSGSTMVQQLFKTSASTSTLPKEGQFLPVAKDILYTGKQWDEKLQVDWEKVKGIFHQYWKTEKPLLFEKSPPHLIRADQIEKHFAPCYFLISIRNPYAQIEGLLRRGWMTSPKEAATFWVKCAKYQKKNMEQLTHTYFFRYEDITNDPNKVVKEIQTFLPEVGNLNFNKTFKAHNVTKKPIKGIKNLNDRKIQSLSKEQKGEINMVLKNHQALLRFYNYEII